VPPSAVWGMGLPDARRSRGRPEAAPQRTLRHATPAMTRRYTMLRDRGGDAKALAEVLLATGS